MRVAGAAVALLSTVAPLAAVLPAGGCADVEPIVVADEADGDGPAERQPLPILDEDLVFQAEIAETDWQNPLRGPPYPIILVHGFSGWSEVGPLEYFFDVKADLLASRGEVVWTPALPPYDEPGERSRVLAAVVDEVLAQTGKRKVHLVGHSQGGLDARVVVSSMGYADKVASLTTVSTPHRGTPVADLARQAPEGALNPAGRLLGWLVGALEGEPPSEADWADDETHDAWDPSLASVVEALSEHASAAFNEANPDRPGVAYFSVAGVSNLHPPSMIDACADAPWGAGDLPDPVDPFLVAAGLYVNTSAPGLFSLRPNDGLVPLDSATYGTFLGCVPADHFDEIGQIADVLPEPSGFSHLELYRKLVDNIRALEDAASE